MKLIFKAEIEPVKIYISYELVDKDKKPIE